MLKYTFKRIAGLGLVLGLAVVGEAFVLNSSGQSAQQGDWPAITREQRPWAYWWWMGSAVDQTNLTHELTRYRDAGYGGVHIIPIYGARGWESNYISYLSPQWMAMLDYTVREADRLDLGVDMTTGTGWCFGGGPYVSEREGNASVVVKTFAVAAGAQLTEKFDPWTTQALMAFQNPTSETGKPQSDSMDLTRRIQPDGTVDWVAPAGEWTVYAVSQKLAAQKVKRAAPGGEGPMLNLIYSNAMPVFLRSHTEAFANYRGAKPRAQYHDSYEYKSEWAPDFFAQFARRRGYQLQTELPALFAADGSRRREEVEISLSASNRLITSSATSRLARVLADYRETVSDVMIEESLPQWVQWSHQRGFITRNEAHGSPGNLLDLYALADVPETEMFRLDRNKLVSKFASSAAHVAGRKLVSCETGTWLKEHFTETLADMKYLVDDLFVSGVNHIFYHGTCYSPDEAGWPGWVFYASYEMNPRNPIWYDARALNDYVARCQSILQAGKPDNDILLYWPIHDFWQKAPAQPLLPHLTVHARGWFEGQPIGDMAEQLWRRGYSFDYISDRQLEGAKVARGGIRVPGGDYRVVVVPPCEVMPLATLEKLLALANSGATVIFSGGLPKDVPGWGDLEARRAKFAGLIARATETPTSRPARTGANSNRTGSEAQALVETRRGRGLILVGEVEAALVRASVARETLVDHEGLYYTRRTISGGKNYFIANRSERAVAGWLPLATAAKSVVLLDPMTERTGVGALRSDKSDSGAPQSEVHVQLQAGESIVVRMLNRASAGSRWEYLERVPQSELLVGRWQVEFLTGGPELPEPRPITQLVSWPEFSNPKAKSFSGTARYTLRFNTAELAGKTAALDLGRVFQSARVKLNDQEYGTLLIPPYRVTVNNLKATGNVLEVEVTSTAANRIRDLDQRGVKWQNFHDINFVNQDYKPFNAANWPLADAGLLGPVTLTALTPLNLREETK